MDIEGNLRAEEEAWAVRNAIFASLLGAESLIKQFGRVPSFHDGEVETIHLVKSGPSHIKIRTGFPDIFGPGHVYVSLMISNVLDVELEGFSAQNVIQELWLRPAMTRPEHLGKGVAVEDGDLEIELEPIFGIGGTIVGRGLTLDWSKDRRARAKN